MRQTILMVVFILCAIFSKAQDNGWMVQVAVYDREVTPSHFYGITDQLFHSKDVNNFHRYFVGTYNENDAKTTSKKLEDQGYKTTVMHESEFNSQCLCYQTPRPQAITASLSSIFFDFDRYNLRGESKSQLNLLVSSLNENPTFVTRLKAHTDSKGSDTYNERLSMNRANAAKNYLIAKGISASRIKIETFGESNPIAKNEVNGKDTEEGRQLNRRVEFEILNDKGTSMDIVEDIFVPVSLQTK